MIHEETIQSINQVIAEFFEKGTKENIVPAKELMPDLIKAGIFKKDEKKGLPLRKMLRALDEANSLVKIPTLHAERKEKSTFWYFVRAGFSYVSDAPNDTGLTKKQKSKIMESESDEHYLINLADELLGQTASRNHKFGFILGNYHKDGKTRSELPVSAYYENANLVIELIKPEDAVSVDHPNRKTESGVTRAEQLLVYADRKRDGLQGKGVNFIEVEYTSFERAEDGSLKREKDKDLEIMQGKLKDFLPA